MAQRPRTFSVFQVLGPSTTSDSCLSPNSRHLDPQSSESWTPHPQINTAGSFKPEFLSLFPPLFPHSHCRFSLRDHWNSRTTAEPLGFWIPAPATLPTLQPRAGSLSLRIPRPGPNFLVPVPTPRLQDVPPPESPSPGLPVPSRLAEPGCSVAQRRPTCRRAPARRPA